MEQVAAALGRGELAVFVGAGASRSWRDPVTGNSWPGIPTASEIIAEARQDRPWLDDLSNSFSDTMYMIRAREGRSALERFILKHTDRPTLSPLPAHTLLASMGIRTFITTNYDTLLERALEDANVSVRSIVSDGDVPLLGARDVALIKYHGCVRQPASIVAATDEYQPLATKLPIVSALLTANLANKSLLFVGFALNDPDFAHAWSHIRITLGERAPLSYAVVRNPTPFQRKYWEDQGVQIIEGDLTDRLRELNHLRGKKSRSGPVTYAAWDSNPFFESLHEIGTKPSETQVADAFLSHLLELTTRGASSCRDISSSGRRAQEMVLDSRPNFHAFRIVSDEALELIELVGEVPGDQAVADVRHYIHQRELISLEIAKLGSLVADGSTLAVYSQSKRVQQFLQGVPRRVQESCLLLIGECRPKSPRPFQDALEIATALNRTAFQLTLVPDMALTHMISSGQVTTLVLGAHAVFLSGDTPIAFVNTAGSAALCAAALRHGVGVWIIAESVKTESVNDLSEARISFAEEEEIFEVLEPELAELRSLGVKIEARNVGYDLVECQPGMRLFTEAQQWSM